MNIVHLIDNIEFMRNVPDKYYELAIVDPPYGIGVAHMNMGVGKGKRCSKIVNRKWEKKDWDSSPPNHKFFQELFRISKNQIIWGGNYFKLPTSQYFAVWDKGDGLRGRSFAEGEYAWVSDGGTRIINLNPVDKDRIHPTQKPVALYKWLLKNYAKPNDKIFDSHVGSGSIRIACHDMGFDFEGCEIDKDYWEAQEARYLTHISQQDLFAPETMQENIYQGEIL